MPAVASTSDRLYCELVRIMFLQTHGETDFPGSWGNRLGNRSAPEASGVVHAQHNQDQFRFRRAAFYSQLKSKLGNILAKTRPPLTDPCLAVYR